MRRIENPEQPYPFNNEEFPYLPMTTQEAEELFFDVADMGKDDLLDIFETVLNKSTNIEDVAWTISATSIGGESFDNPDKDMDILAEYPVDVFAYGICFGLWASCPNSNTSGSEYISDHMNASITSIENKSPQQGLFRYSQACLDFVYNNDPAYFELAVDSGKEIYDQQLSVPFLYGAAAGRMLYMFRQADIADEMNMTWEQYGKKFYPYESSEPWLNQCLIGNFVWQGDFIFTPVMVQFAGSWWTDNSQLN